MNGAMRSAYCALRLTRDNLLLGTHLAPTIAAKRAYVGSARPR